MIEINLNALKENYRLLVQHAGQSVTVAAVVKADAYGLGISKVAPSLYDAGVRVFYVATLEEGMALRVLLPESEIRILNGLRPASEDLYKTHNLIPILNSAEELKQFIACKINQPVMIMVDTGMNRLGFRLEELEMCLDQGLFKNNSAEVLLSHFACADEPDHFLNAKQVKKFQECATFFPGAVRSFSNSHGVFNFAHMHCDEVRCGMVLYGLNPICPKSNPMHQVVTLKVPILQVKQGLEGESTGYNATYRFHENTWLAIVEMGYADGFHRAGGNRAKLYWKGTACPVVGAISMDLTICDLSAIPDDQRPKAGDHMDVIGSHQSADDLAQDMGTIGYEILTSLGKRYKRVYLDQE